MPPSSSGPGRLVFSQQIRGSIPLGGTMTTDNNAFHSPTKGQLAKEQVVAEIVSFMKGDSKAFYNLVIGTDSSGVQGKLRQKMSFITALVIHKKGKGGRYFWQENHLMDITTLRDKIYAETLLSVNLAQKFIPSLKMALTNGEKYELEIHLDVGEKGETRDMIKEVIGIVSGNGFIAKTKPYAYGASTVADKHT